ncbi:MAG: hypothetical protein IJ773_02690 [Lachnospiraceae bacterium]|nr:hypothetical protein [Lachnospiraceae bacterium]
MSVGNITKNGSASFVGLFSCLAAVAAVIVYAAMKSMYFTPVVVICLLLGVALYVFCAVADLKWGFLLPVFLYLVAFYHFLILEVEYRMDTIVDTGVGSLDGIFFVAVAMFLIAAISGVISAVMQAK